MDLRFIPHNRHLDGVEIFIEQDPHLRRLAQQRLVHSPTLLESLPTASPGLYSVGGGRQVGKTTLLKQWMLRLLRRGVSAQSVGFLTGELIDDQHSLVQIIKATFEEMPPSATKYLIIDEVTYIRDWDKGLKFAADAGFFENAVVIFTGSDLSIIKEARMRFPGRRGRSGEVDFHLHPLSFAESVKLKKTELNHAALLSAWREYLAHGGYLTAMNDYAQAGQISASTYQTYSDWVRGDMLKRGRQEGYLREILSAVIKRTSTPVSWNALSQDLSIDHPKTVADYVELLSSLDVLLVLPALQEDKKSAAPKKPKKIYFRDPFIFHSICNWLGYDAQFAQSPEWQGKLTEAAVISLYSRTQPVYYIKAEGEIDLALVQDGKIRPIEIKWTSQSRPKDLKQLKKYKNSTLLVREHPNQPELGEVRIQSLVENLMDLESV